MDLITNNQTFPRVSCRSARDLLNLKVHSLPCDGMACDGKRSGKNTLCNPEPLGAAKRGTFWRSAKWL